MPNNGRHRTDPVAQQRSPRGDRAWRPTAAGQPSSSQAPPRDL